MGDEPPPYNGLNTNHDPWFRQSRTRPRGILAVAALVVAGVVSLPVPVGAEVRFRCETPCLEPGELTRRIQRLLAQERMAWGRTLRFEVHGKGVQGSTLVSLVVATPEGSVLLERSYSFKPEDCDSAADFLMLVLERFLTTLPLERWEVVKALRAKALPAASRPASAPAVPSGAPSRGTALELSLHLAVNMAPVPLDMDLELGGQLLIGAGDHRLSAGVLVRGSLPHGLGGGGYQVTAPMASVGWQYAAGRLRPSLELRLGGLVVSGHGYFENYTRGLFWVEAAGALQWRWRALALGVQLAASPMMYEASTFSGQSTRALPGFRVGVRAIVPLWENYPE